MDIKNTDGIIIGDKYGFQTFFAYFIHKSMIVAWLPISFKNIFPREHFYLFLISKQFLYDDRN